MLTPLANALLHSLFPVDPHTPEQPSFVECRREGEGFSLLVNAERFPPWWAVWGVSPLLMGGVLCLPAEGRHAPLSLTPAAYRARQQEDDAPVMRRIWKVLGSTRGYAPLRESVREVLGTQVQRSVLVRPPPALSARAVQTLAGWHEVTDLTNSYLMVNLLPQDASFRLMRVGGRRSHPRLTPVPLSWDAVCQQHGRRYGSTEQVLYVQGSVPNTLEECWKLDYDRDPFTVSRALSGALLRGTDSELPLMRELLDRLDVGERLGRGPHQRQMLFRLD